MIGIILGGVIGVATIVFLSFQKPDPKQAEQSAKDQDDSNANQQDVQEQKTETLTKEQIEEREREKKKLQQQASQRRDRLLQNLTPSEREAFEGYINELTSGKEADKKKQSGETLLIEIGVIAFGLLFVYALVVILGDRFYTPIDIFNILKHFFLNSDSYASHTQQSNDSPFITTAPTPSGSDL